MKIAICLFALIVATLAEPPAPNSRYLPARNGNGNGNGHGNGNGNGNGHGNGNGNGNGAPSAKYGPPSSQYGPPASQYGAPQNGNGNGYQNGNGNGNGNGYQNGNGNGNGNGYQNGNGNGNGLSKYGVPSPQYGVPNGNGYAGDEETEPASYQFEYAVEDAEAGLDFGHMEAREGDVATGKYYVLLPDGRKQTVEYTADADGYKPVVTYEEAAGNGGYQNGGYPANGNGYPKANGNGNGHRNGNGNGNGNGGYRNGNGNGGYNY